jgi:hypothetical protein
MSGSLVLRSESGGASLRSTTSLALRAGGAYVPPDYLAEGKFFVAEVYDHTTALVSIDKANVPADPLAGAWEELTLTRNFLGDPATNLDGALLARYNTAAVDGWQTYPDTGLRPGTWAHYGLFAKYNFGGTRKWVRVATAEVLLPQNFNYAQRLYNRIPEWYREADLDTSERLVERLLNGFGQATDINRTWASMLDHTWDPGKVPARILPYMSEALGVPYEKSIGDARVRTLLANLAYLRKTKGTKDAVEGYLSALSGYRVTAYPGPNIIVTPEDGEFRLGVGNWKPIDAGTTISRKVGGLGTNAPVPPNGVLAITRTSTTGTATALLGHPTEAVPTIYKMALAPGTSRQVAISFNARTTSGALAPEVTFTWTDTGSFSSTNTVVMPGATTTWGRKLSAWVSVPNNARYVALSISAPGITTAVELQVGEIMLVDRRWRPDDMPGSVNIEPFSTSGSATYAGTGFYDQPRRVWLNVFPQRTNFALNSNFALNNLPAGAWTVTDSPTYGGLPFAYSTYTAVAAGEDDYADLADGFNSITPSWTVAFDTANNRLRMISSTTGIRMAQVRSQAFPVLPGQSYSAALEMASNVANTKGNLRIVWMAKGDPNTVLNDEDGVPVASRGDEYNLVVGSNTRVEIRNAIAPEGAGFGRLVVDARNTVSFEAYVQKALIEDNPVPGVYFDGNVVEGAFGDFSFIGTAQQSYSVYYMNFQTMLGAGSNRILTASTEMLPVFTDSPRITTAKTGLYNL